LVIKCINNVYALFAFINHQWNCIDMDIMQLKIYEHETI
jgi:hypothetical protein